MISQCDKETKTIRFSFKRKGKEVGRAWLILIHNDLHPQPYGLLEDVFVDEAYRGEGVASELVHYVVARAKQEHCYKVIATSRTERTKVHTLYEALGFVSLGYEFRMNLE